MPLLPYTTLDIPPVLLVYQATGIPVGQKSVPRGKHVGTPKCPPRVYQRVNHHTLLVYHSPKMSLVAYNEGHSGLSAYMSLVVCHEGHLWGSWYTSRVWN